MKIQIESYSSNWPIVFQELKAVYAQELKGLYLDIQHVGSTSVPGLAAKPAIDIDIVISNGDKVQEIIGGLKHLGYDHKGNMGIKNREAFAATSIYVPTTNPLRQWMQYHLYVCMPGSVALKNHLMFRDFLKNNPETAAQYGDLKRNLILQSDCTIQNYCARKTAFIIDKLQKAGMEAAEIDAIVEENQ